MKYNEHCLVQLSTTNHNKFAIMRIDRRMLKFSYFVYTKNIFSISRFIKIISDYQSEKITLKRVKIFIYYKHFTVIPYPGAITE